jgi:hypothetical protein
LTFAGEDAMLLNNSLLNQLVDLVPLSCHVLADYLNEQIRIAFQLSVVQPHLQLVHQSLAFFRGLAVEDAVYDQSDLFAHSQHVVILALLQSLFKFVDCIHVVHEAFGINHGFFDFIDEFLDLSQCILEVGLRGLSLFIEIFQ